MDVFISCALCMTMDRVRCVCGRISYCRDEDVFCHSVIMSQGYNVAGMKLGCRVNSCVQCCVCASVVCQRLLDVQYDSQYIFYLIIIYHP
jgi:hypothetical protein